MTISSPSPRPSPSRERELRVRTFFAVELSAGIHSKLVALKRELSNLGAAVRWTRDENLHATVKFLGAVAEGRLPELRAALAQAVGTTPPLAAAVRGMGVFPTMKRPRVVWVGLRCPPLGQLAATVDATLAPLGFEPETRPFAAHITLGRVRDTRGWPRLEAAVHTHWDDDFGACTLAELVAFRSDLRRDGALYTKLWSIRFGG
jgi:2'-5' RNA ligase